MIAFDLVCRRGEHRFEGWFASSAEFDRQKATQILLCPVCGDAAVDKAIMAPNIGRKGNQQGVVQRPDRQADNAESVAIANMAEMPAAMTETIGKLVKMQAAMLEKSDWVGDKFAEEARAIHYGEAPERVIHGETTINEAQALHDEGVKVAPLPLPFIPPEAKN
jgi:hypothetical protein